MKMDFRIRSRLGRRAGMALLAGSLVVLIGWIALHFVPLPSALVNGQSPDLEFVDRNGEPLRSVRELEHPFQQRVSYGEIPQPLIEATLAAEDERFWSHHGVDIRASLRAVWQLVRYRHVVSGGSTITQQLIKITEPRPRTFRTKLMEALQAARLEQVWDKQRILAEYLNRLDYGNFNRGAAMAAQYYFAKPLRDLTPAECALLASVPQAPSRLNPNLHPERARKRQEWILTRMRTAGWLTTDELNLALNEPFHLAKPQRPFEAPHFIDLILANYQKELSAFSGPIKTTLDLELNRFAENVLRAHLADLQAQHVSNGALVVLDNRTGYVLALVGSENYFSASAGQVNGAWTVRSPGSALKPFTYLLALERGATPATVVADVPSEFVTSTGLFAPVNYNRHCYGPMRYRLALANSLNISAVKVLDSIGGPEPLQRLLQRCGLSTLTRPPSDYGLGLTIGNAEVRLLELANAYACLARLGEFKPYRLLATGSRITRDEVRGRVADSSEAYLIADMLSDNDARTLAFGAESALRFEFPVACKTGTSSDFRDNWAFGYTPEFTVGVWVGNADGSPMQHISGVTGAGPILHDLFGHLHERYGTTWYSQPPNVVECSINPITGKRLARSEQVAIKEKFLANNLPPLEGPDDYETILSSKRAVRLGTEYRDWFLSGDNWLGDRAVIGRTRDAVRILFPPAGTIIYLDADLPDHGSRLLLRASGPEQIEWRSGSLKLERSGNREIALLTEGRHELSVHDPLSGAEAQTWIEVRSR